MTTTAQVLAADSALSSALEEYIGICRNSAPKGFRGMSFAMEEAENDVKSEAKQSLWQKFKAFVNRIVDWIVSRFKKLGEKKKTEAEKFQEEMDEIDARWKANLDKTMENLRKNNEEFYARNKPAHDEILRKTREVSNPDKMDALMKRVFDGIKSDVVKDATAAYNEALKKYTCLGALLDKKTYSDSSFSSVTRLPVIDEAYAEVKKITQAIKDLGDMVKNDFNNDGKLHDIMSRLEGNALSTISDKFKGREGQYIQVTDIPTMSSLSILVDRVKNQFASMKEWTCILDFQEAVSAIRDNMAANKALDEADEKFSALLKDMHQALGVLISRVSADFHALQLTTSGLRYELVAMYSLPLIVSNDLTMKWGNDFFNRVRKENSYVLKFTTDLTLRMKIQDMLAGVK